MMRYKNREVFVVRPYDEELVVVQVVQTGDQEVAKKTDIEGYTEEVDSKEVQLGMALNKGDQNRDAYKFDQAPVPPSPEPITDADTALKVRVITSEDERRQKKEAQEKQKAESKALADAAAERARSFEKAAAKAEPKKPTR